MADGKVNVEFTSSFMAEDKEEAEALLDELFDAVSDIVCPPDINRGETCTNCNGTLINPPLDEDEEPYEGENLRYAPGEPCWVCTVSDHPGICIPCARDHMESSRMHMDGMWVSSADRAMLRFCERVLELWEENPELAKAELVKERDTISEFFEYSPEN